MKLDEQKETGHETYFGACLIVLLALRVFLGRCDRTASQLLPVSRRRR